MSEGPYISDAELAEAETQLAEAEAELEEAQLVLIRELIERLSRRLWLEEREHALRERLYRESQPPRRIGISDRGTQLEAQRAHRNRDRAAIEASAEVGFCYHDRRRLRVQCKSLGTCCGTRADLESQFTSPSHQQRSRSIANLPALGDPGSNTSSPKTSEKAALLGNLHS